MTEFIRRGNERTREVIAAKKAEAVRKHREAADLADNDNDVEAKQVGREAQVLLSEKDDLVKQMSAVQSEGLRELTIWARKYFSFLETDEEAAQFIDGLLSQKSDNGEEPGSDERVEDNPADHSEGKARAKYERKLGDLTEVQLLIARSRFRLLYAPDASEMNDVLRYMSFRSTMERIVQNEPLEQEYEYDKVKMGYNQNWNLVLPKLLRALSYIEGFSPTETKWPLTDVQRSRLPQLAKIYDILWRMNAVPAFKGLTFEEILEYTKTKKPIDLLEYNPGVRGEKSTDEPESDDEKVSGSEEVHEEREERKHFGEGSLVEIEPLTPNESSFLALCILQSGYQLVDTDRRKLEKATSKIPLSSVQETGAVKEFLKQKFAKYFGLPEDEQNAFLIEQDDLAMMLLVLVIQNWNSLGAVGELIEI